MCNSNYSEKDGLTEIIFFGFCSQTGPQQTIRLGVVVGRSGQGGGPFVAELSKDGPSKLVTPVVDLLLSSSRSTPFPLLPLTLSAPSTTVKTWGIKKHHTSGSQFQIKPPTNRQCSIFFKRFKCVGFSLILILSFRLQIQSAEVTPLP